jgi:DNA-binding transcriptional LysR family regulator
MELNHLKYFYEVAKSGSFSEAARRLRISQSALSKAVALLEDREGVKLLERSKKGVALTEIGAEVYAQSEAVFQQLTDIENTCRGTKQSCSGLLAFGASDHVTNYLLVPPLKEMRAEHPLVIPSVLSATPHEIIAAIARNECEFGLFFTRVPAPNLTYEVLQTISMAVVCHPKFKKEIKNAEKPAQLRAAINELGFIGSVGLHYQHHPSEELIKLVGEQPNVSFEASSQETQKRLCLEGGGVAFLARFMVEEEIKNGDLIEVVLPRPLRLDLLLATRKSQALSLSARTFLEKLRSGGH